jgi:GNAT superfamily N-acetyltransferase
MVDDDVDSAIHAQVAAFAALDEADGAAPRPLTEDVMARIRLRYRHFLANDPAGSWVATSDGEVVGLALALKREGLWGLSLFAVDPAAQLSGIGRQLLDAALTYAEGCDRATILSTHDPRAMRLYATSDFELFPQVGAHGEVDRAALPALSGRVRAGSVADADWADDVDRAVRGAARGPDHVRMATDMPMFAIDDVEGRGYAYVRNDGIVYTVAGTNDETATTLLWQCLAHLSDLGVAVSVDHMPAEQQWAIRASYRARLKVKPDGPAYWRNGRPANSYLPSGAYL